MKKQLLAALTTSLIVSSLGTAFAADDSSQDIKIDGSFSVQYRDQHDSNRISGDPDTIKTAFKSTLTLNVDAPLAKNFDAYATLNYQNINTNANVGFVKDYFNSDKKNNTGLTAIGLKYKNAGYSYVIGSQALTLGGGLAYDNGYIGKYALPYALNVSKKVGATDLNVIAAKTNYQDGVDNDTFYTVQGSYDVTPKTNLGAMYTHVSYGDTMKNVVKNSSVNFYSIYGSNKLSDKLTLSGEYIKSDAATDNKGVQANLSYKLDDKNTLGTGYYHVEDQASIYDYNGGGMTTSPNNNTEGYVVSWKHNFDKNISLKVADVNYKIISKNPLALGTNNDRNRFYSTVTVNF